MILPALVFPACFAKIPSLGLVTLPHCLSSPIAHCLPWLSSDVLVEERRSVGVALDLLLSLFLSSHSSDVFLATVSAIPRSQRRVSSRAAGLWVRGGEDGVEVCLIPSAISKLHRVTERQRLFYIQT